MTLRKRRGWTQAEMAAYLGVDRGYISNIENGRRNVTLEMLWALARGFGMTMSKLIAGLWA